MKEIKYYVNEKEGIVTGVYVAYNDLRDELYNYEMNLPFGVYFAKSDLLKCFSCKIVAKAKCSGGDVFNEEIGKRIVREKIDMKYNRLRAKAYSKLAKFFDRLAAECNMISGKYWIKADSAMTDLTDYYGSRALS